MQIEQIQIEGLQPLKYLLVLIHLVKKSSS